MLAYSAAVF
jgi:dipeptidyl-peptidase III